MKEEIEFSIRLNGKEYIFTISGEPPQEHKLTHYCNIAGNAAEILSEIILYEKTGKEILSEWKEMGKSIEHETH